MSGAEWGPGWCQPRHASPAGAHGSLLPVVDRFAAELLPYWIPDGYEPRLWGWSRQTVDIGTALDADGHPLYRTVAVIQSRQNAKTTKLNTVMAAWCSLGLRVAFTMHERNKARAKWLLLADALEGRWPKRFRAQRRLGDEVLHHVDSGGLVMVVSPTDAGGRSDTWDRIVADEAAFLRPDFLAAARPAMVTRRDAQIWLVSSAGHDGSHDLQAAREAALAEYHDGEATTALIEWGVADSADPKNEEVWPAAVPTLDHPGGATRTALRDDLRNMGEPEFAREYLGRWTTRLEVRPVPMGLWGEALRDEMPPVDDLYNVVFSVDRAPDQSYAAIVIAGRHTDTGDVWSAVWAHAVGDHWLNAELAAAAEHVRPRRVIGDKLAATEVLALERRRGRAIEATGATEMALSCAALITSLHGRSARIVRDDALTVAAETAERREISDTGWAFKRRGADITPLVATALGRRYCAQLAAREEHRL